MKHWKRVLVALLAAALLFSDAGSVIASFAEDVEPAPAQAQADPAAQDAAAEQAALEAVEALAAEETAPAQEEAAPAQEETAPAQEEASPAQEETAPEEEETLPVQEDGDDAESVIVEEQTELTQQDDAPVKTGKDPLQAGGSGIKLDIAWVKPEDGTTPDYTFGDPDADFPDHLICTPVDNRNKSVTLRYAVTTPTDVTVPVGAIKIRVPKTIFENWDGGTDRVVLEQETGKDLKDQLYWQVPKAPGMNSESDFNYVQDPTDENSYIVQNCREISGGKLLTFLATYDYRPTQVPGGWVNEDGSYGGDYFRKTITGSMVVVMDGQVVATDRDTAQVEVHTQVRPTVVSKHQPESDKDSATGIYYSWQNNWGEKPADADNYFYVIWYADLTRDARNNQPFTYTLTDTPDSATGGQVIGAKQLTATVYAQTYSSLSSMTTDYSGIYGSSVDEGQVGVGYNSTGSHWQHMDMLLNNSLGTVYQSRRYAFLVRYPISLLEGLSPTEKVPVKNTLKMTEQWKSGHKAVQTSEGTIDVPAPPAYAPGSGINKAHSGNAANATIINGGDTFLSQGYDVTLSAAANPAFEYRIAANAQPRVAPTANPDGSYTAQPYTLEVRDGSVYMTTSRNNNIPGAMTFSEYTAQEDRNPELLTDGDYTFTRLRIVLSEYDGARNATLGTWSRNGFVSTDYDRYQPVEVWCRQPGGSFTLFGTAQVDAGNGRLNFTSQDGSYTVSGNTAIARSCDLTLPENTCEFKVVHQSSFYETDIDCYPIVRINATDHVKERVNLDLDAGRAGTLVTNLAYMTSSDAAGVIKEQCTDISSPTGTASYWLTKVGLSTRFTKEVVGTLGDDPVNTQETREVFLTAINSPTLPSGYYSETAPVDISPYKLTSGVFYDLLPLGTTVDMDSIRVGKGVYATRTSTLKYVWNDFPEECVDVQLVDYKNTGRKMLIIKYSNVPEEYLAWYPNANYFAVHAWFTMINSYVNIKDQGTSTLNTAAFVNLDEDAKFNGASDVAFNQITEHDQFADLRAQHHDDIVFAQTTVNFKFPSVSQSGPKKDVATRISNGLYRPDGVSYTGDSYNYRLNYQTSDSTFGADIVFFDILENGTTDNNNQVVEATQWQGKFDHVDTTYLESKHSYNSETKKTDGPLMAPVVYYATSIPTPDDMKAEKLGVSPVWSTTLPDDPTTVKAIAVDCRWTVDGTRFVLEKKGSMNAFVYMTAPAGPSVFAQNDAPVAVNETVVEQTNLTLGTQTEHGYHDTIKAFARVTLVYENFSFTKVKAETIGDGLTPEPLSGATFKLYRRVGGRPDHGGLIDPNNVNPYIWELEDTVTSGADGVVEFTHLGGGEYRLVETKAPANRVRAAGQWTIRLNADGTFSVNLMADNSADGVTSENINFVTDETNTISGLVLPNSFFSSVDVDVTKVFNPANDGTQTGDYAPIYPDSVKIQLFADGNPALDTSGNAMYLNLSARNSWSDSFTDLPKFSNYGESEIAYTVREVSMTVNGQEINAVNGVFPIMFNEQVQVPDSDPAIYQVVGRWNAAVTGSQNNGYTVTNTWTPATEDEEGEIHFSIRKVDDQGALITSDTAQFLVEQKQEDGSFATLTTLETTRGSVEVTGLEPGVYRISESKAPESFVPAQDAFTLEITKDRVLKEVDTDNLFNLFTRLFDFIAGTADSYTWDGDELTLTVANQPIYGTISIEKKAEDQDGEPLTMTGTSTFEVSDSEGTVVATLTIDGNGTAVSDPLPYGTYTIAEKDHAQVTDYLWESVTLSETTVSIQTQDQKVEVSAVNVYRLETTEFAVYKVWDDGDNVDGKRPDSVTVQLLANGDAVGEQVTLDESNGWSAAWTELRKSSGGEDIVYSVEEVNVPQGYTVSYEAGEGQITVTNTHTPEVTEVNGSKTWVDEDDQDGIRPESITIRLYANGTEVDSRAVTAEDEWSWSFTELPKYEAGQEIVYTITEDAVQGYETEINGYDVVNTHEPELTEVSGSKTWKDENNKDGSRPGKITIRLYANGKEVEALTVTARDNWSWSFTELPKYEAGKEITYTISEDKVQGYKTEIKGYDVTNTHTPPPSDTPKTGDNSHLGLYLPILLSGAVGLAVLVLTGKKRGSAK